MVIMIILLPLDIGEDGDDNENQDHGNDDDKDQDVPACFNWILLLPCCCFSSPTSFLRTCAHVM